MQSSYPALQITTRLKPILLSFYTSPILTPPMIASHSMLPFVDTCTLWHDSTITHRSATTASASVTLPIHVKQVQSVHTVWVHMLLVPASVPGPTPVKRQHHAATPHRFVLYAQVPTQPLTAAAPFVDPSSTDTLPTTLLRIPCSHCHSPTAATS